MSATITDHEERALNRSPLSSPLSFTEEVSSFDAVRIHLPPPHLLSKVAVFCLGQDIKEFVLHPSSFHI